MNFFLDIESTNTKSWNGMKHVCLVLNHWNLICWLHRRGDIMQWVCRNQVFVMDSSINYFSLFYRADKNDEFVKDLVLLLSSGFHFVWSNVFWGRRITELFEAGAEHQWWWGCWSWGEQNGGGPLREVRVSDSVEAFGTCWVSYGLCMWVWQCLSGVSSIPPL